MGTYICDGSQEAADHLYEQFAQAVAGGQGERFLFEVKQRFWGRAIQAALPSLHELWALTRDLGATRAETPLVLGDRSYLLWAGGGKTLRVLVIEHCALCRPDNTFLYAWRNPTPGDPQRDIFSAHTVFKEEGPASREDGGREVVRPTLRSHLDNQFDHRQEQGRAFWYQHDWRGPYAVSVEPAELDAGQSLHLLRHALELAQDPDKRRAAAAP